MLSFARDRQDATLIYQTECTVSFVSGMRLRAPAGTGTFVLPLR